MGFLKKVLRIVLSPLSLIDKGLGNFVAKIGAVALSAFNPLVGAAYAALWGFANAPKTPSVSPSAVGRLNTTIDPRTPRKIVFGETAMASDLRDYEYTGTDDEFVHYFIVNASHTIDAFTEIWFDDKIAWTSGGGIQGEFVGYLTVATRTEGTAANAINISARMGTTRRYTGLAYVHLRFKRTGATSKATSPFSTSIPQRITTVGRGALCYDPRLDSTVPGGSGSHRSNNQTTWAFTRNPALQLLAYFIGWRINGKLAVGKGVPVARLDLASFMAGANACDEPVALAAGGTEPRYRSDGVFSEADDMGLVIGAFKTTMNAELDDSDGRFALRMILDDLDDPIAAFGPDDFLSGLAWSPVAEISERFNVVRGQYTDARDESLYQMVDYPEVLLASVDGIERSHSLPLPLVQSPSQAQRLAKQVLQRQQYSGTLEMTLGHTGWLVQKFDIVTITHPPLGFAEKLFRVATISVGTHGQTQVMLREENAAIYAWDEDERPPVVPAAGPNYNFENNPIVQAIDASGAVINVVGPAPSILEISWSWDGALLDGQLPVTLAPTVERDGVDIRTSDDVSYAIVERAGLVGKTTLVNINGDPDKGFVTIDDTVTSSGSFDLTVTVGAIPFGPFRVDLVRRNLTAPSSNGVGGGVDTSLESVATSSYTAMTGTHPADTALEVVIASGETLRLNSDFEYSISGAPTAGGRMECRGEYYDGSVWVSMGAGVLGSTATVTAGSPATRDNGSLSGAWSVGALAAGTYPVRLVGRLNTGTRTLTPVNGSAISSKS